MIIDVIDRLKDYEAMHHLFPVAVAFLEKENLVELENGRHSIQGEDVYASVERGPGKAPEEAKLEVHNKYIDIQIILQGTDSIGWKPRATCVVPIEEYNAEKDVQFFSDQPDSRVSIHANQFVIFFPEDAHAPMVSPEMIHKIVIKIAV